MKAIRVHAFGGPEVLKLEDVDAPRPGPGQVLVRVKAVGVNPVDVSIRNGAYKNVAPPYTPGSDAAGLVEATGDGVAHVKTGDRVFITGTTSPSFTGAYAELALSRAGQVHPLPAPLTFPQGAAIYVPYGTAYRSLVQRARAQANETVFVHGASGGVGIASVQLARAMGLRVIGTASTDAGRDLVLKEGAHHVLDHKAPDYLQRLTALTEGRGPDIILEMASHHNLGKDLTVIAKYGRIVVIGCRGPVEINPREAMLRDAAILGMHLGNPTETEAAAIWAGLSAGFENRTLRPVIGKELPLAEAAQAQKAVMEQNAYGKIVLIP
ncbi:MAG: NADPH:quinone reductase [Planctomycetaceae bacterium]|nr:NADPH:quinone reductase [Planctomycetaceae bacterium]